MNAPKTILAKSLNSPEVINQFTQNFISLQNNWSQLNSQQRMTAIVTMTNNVQKSVGVPAIKIGLISNPQLDGQFFPEDWSIKINSRLLNYNSNALSSEIAEELAASLYHEIRHSEQFFRIAQKEALKFNDNGKLKNSAQIELETGIREEIVKKAITSVQNLTPEQKKQLLQELAITDSWSRSLYPKNPAEAEVVNRLRNKLDSSYKLFAAAQEKYDFARNHTRQFSWSQINQLEAVANAAEKQYKIARANYYKELPEEADAEATENKFRASYRKELASNRQRKTQSVRPSTNRNKSEEDWTDKFYNRNIKKQSPEDSNIRDEQSLVLKPENHIKESQSVVIEPDNVSSPTLYQKINQIAMKMPHNLEKLGLNPQNSQDREIFITMYAINTGIDPRTLLKDSPYNSLIEAGETSNHTESIILQATAKIDEAAKASTVSTAKNIDRGL